MLWLTLVIPAYNEADGVAQTAEKLRKVLPQLRTKYRVELVFVDDGSRDNTGELLRQEWQDDADVRVVSHSVNRGLGAAIRTGFQHAHGDIVVTTDFDGTYDFSTIPALVSQLVDSNVDIVTASPYHPDGAVEGVPGYRLLFSFGASLLYRVLVRWNIHTWTALFRAYRRPVITTVGFTSDDFLAGTELLVGALRKGFTVAEYPTVLRTRSFGQSSIRIARVTLSHLKLQAKLLLNQYQPPSPEIEMRSTS
jgi:dolichol-phosphate mannosyltransferase